MITSSPAILTYAIVNIRGRIADLRELGFARPSENDYVEPGDLDLRVAKGSRSNTIRARGTEPTGLGACSREY
jgi:hypothetical protein